MGLGRLFAVLTPITCAVVLAASWGIYSLASENATRNRSEALRISANMMAQNLSIQLERINGSLEALANDPGLADLFQSADDQRLAAEAERLAALLPATLRVRLLYASVNEPDASKTPHMGFADLDLVRQAAASAGAVAPMVHAFGSEHGHLAAARRVVSGDRVAGVILVSFSTDFIGKTLAGAETANGGIELAQGDLALGYRGDRALRQEAPDFVVDVPGSAWKLRGWYPSVAASGAALLYPAIIILSACALIAVLFFIAYRRFSGHLNRDFELLQRAVTEVVGGRPKGSYPVKMKESQALIAILAKGKTSEVVAPRKTESYRKLEAMLEKEIAAPAAFPAKQRGIEVKVEHEQGDDASIFKSYDIRGIVGETLTRKRVFDIGRALGSEAADCGERTIIVARDGRASSPELSEALAKGILESGCDVIDIGRVPTPVLYFAAHHLESRSGVMVTGSHNPPEYNGLKMVIAGETLYGDRIQRLRRRIESGVLQSGRGSLEKRNVATDYIGAVMEEIHIGRPMKIVLDCGNGVAGELAPVLFRTLGCEVVELFCEVDGRFPNHHPDPSKPENLQSLIRKVTAERADLGIAFDGDGDRLGVVDSAGKIIWPDRQMMIYAADVLAREPGADIIYDVKCSRHLAGVILKRGGRPIMWKTGHSLIKAKIKETGAKLAGEMSGHIFFNDRWYGFDDGLYSAARLIEILSADSRSSSEVFGELPDSVNTPELNVALEEGENFRFVHELQAAADFKGAKITEIDGLRVDFADGWGLVRASNTTPSLVIRFEADSREALEGIQQQFKKLMKKVKPDIALPF